jgi:hypothetical protein
LSYLSTALVSKDSLTQASIIEAVQHALAPPESTTPVLKSDSSQ